MNGRPLVVAASAAALLITPSFASPQDQRYADPSNVLGGSGGNLVYTAVVPCRIADTRLEGGRLLAGAARDFDVAGTLSGQGGAPNCLVPFGPATAAVLNFVAVSPLAAGNMRAWAFGGGAPSASIINYTAGVNIANAVVVPLCDPAGATCDKDLTVRADVGDTHLVVDVLGYFSAPPPVTVPWSEVTGKPTGFADDVDNDTTYSASGGITVTGTNISADPAILQRRVIGTCPVGSSVRLIDAAGAVTCETDDNTTLTPGLGLTLSGNVISVDFAVTQRRVVGNCAAGSSIRLIDATGSAVCEADNDTTYSAGSGLNLSGTTFSANTAVVQGRVTGTCDSGIRTINQNGTVSCGPHIQGGTSQAISLCNTETNVDFPDTFAEVPSVVVSPQGLPNVAIPPNSYCVVDEITTTSFNFCCFGSVPDSVTWIAIAQ